MKTLLFIFISSTTEWKPLKGLDASSEGPVHEARSLPGNVVGLGATPEEAEKNLKATLDCVFARAGSPETWYRKAWKSVSDEDRQAFGRTMARVASELGLKSTDGYEYATVRGDMDAVKC